MLDEAPCSRSMISFFDSNSSEVMRKCGSVDNDLFNKDLNSKLILQSKSNEMAIQFLTHDYNEVIYWTETGLNESSIYRLYRGFELFYTFVEEAGDCYFQINSNLKCGYEAFSGDWVIHRAAETSVATPEMSKNSELLCFDCSLKAEIPLIGETSQSPVLVTSLIRKNKQFMKFSFKLTANANLLIKIVYEKEFVVSGVQTSMPVPVHLGQAKSWRHVTIRLGRSAQDFRIVFVLEKKAEVGANGSAPTVLLDNIAFFETSFDCESNEFPGSCLKNQMHSIESNNKLCKTNVSPCLRNKCKNGALCLNSENHDYVCQCADGFTGKYCESLVDPCQSNKCSPHAQCVPASNTSHLFEYTCRCDVNYHGEFCEFNYTPCKLANNPCNQLKGQGVCVGMGTPVEPLKFACECSPLFTGSHCEEKLQVDCAENCQHVDKNATCIQMNSKTVCQCSSGFRGDTCRENIDNCGPVSPCQHNGTCVDQINGFKCDCDPRYTGAYCQEAKICAQCNKAGTQYCDRTTAKCVCHATHHGEKCETAVDPCLGQPCLNQGECFSNKTDPAVFKCQCKDKFKGERCELSESKCDSIDCLNGGTCVDLPDKDTFQCQCAPNFDGVHCENFNSRCDQEPCQNGATCFDYKDDYKCHCLPGFTGKDCDIFINNCEDNLCENDADCLSLANVYICLCKPGTIGKYCENSANKCAGHKCMNGACQPNAADTHYTCKCQSGYEGKYCDRKINKCSGGLCGNGTCIDLLDKYECSCPQGFRNSNCQETSYCSMLATQCVIENTLACLKHSGGSRCQCKPGFEGDKCEKAMNPCKFAKNPCHQSGECIPTGLDTYECINCKPGFTGKRCNETVNYCSHGVNPCQHNGSCLSALGDYVCVCPDGFAGKSDLFQFVT